MKNFIATTCAAFAAISMSTALAQTYPSKTIRMVVHFPPGGPTDLVARMTAQKLAERYGQPFLVENRSGAGGTLGAANAAKRSGDGYAFFLGAVHHTIAESLYTKLPYSLTRDFVPITVLAYVPNVVVVHPKHTNINSLKDLMAFAKANPETTRQAAFVAAKPLPASYAGIVYWGVHTFTGVSAAGQAVPFKFKVVPAAGELARVLR